MLHIILAILKIIGILLLILIGLLLFAAAGILLAPVCYKGTVNKDADVIQAQGKATWLFHLFSATLLYHQEKGVSYTIRICGIELSRLLRFFSKFKRKKNKDKDMKESSVPELKAAQIDNELEEISENKEDITEDNFDDTDFDTEEEDDVSIEGISVREALEDMTQKKPNFISLLFQRIKGIFYKIIGGILFLLHLPGKIWNLFRNITLTLKELYGKIKEFKKFLLTEEFKGAKSSILREVKVLINHVRPQRIEGELAFGFENPALTGELLAVLSICYPIYKDKIQIIPYFDRTILEGRLMISGRIYGVRLTITALRLFFDPNIKYMIKRFT